MENKFFNGKLKYVKGEASEPLPDKHRLILHLVPNSGVLTNTISVAICKRYPIVEKEYKLWYRSQNKFTGGNIQSIMCQSDLMVVNMIAQHGIMSQKKPGDPPIQYDQLEACLNKVAEIAKENSSSIHCPRIGAGLSGGSWEEIEKLLDKCILSKNINITVYDLEQKEEKK